MFWVFLRNAISEAISTLPFASDPLYFGLLWILCTILLALDRWVVLLVYYLLYAAPLPLSLSTYGGDAALYFLSFFVAGPGAPRSAWAGLGVLCVI